VADKKKFYSKQRQDALAGATDRKADIGSRKKSYGTANKIYNKLTKKGGDAGAFDRDLRAQELKSSTADFDRKQPRKANKTTQRRQPRG
jgi:hypothetical protein